MLEIVLMIHFIAAFLVVVLVLLQQGKGASMGAAFGGGASATLFGSRGPASFLMKLTGLVVAVFFATSLTLAYLAAKKSHQQLNLELPPATVTTLPMHKEAAPPVAVGVVSSQDKKKNSYIPSASHVDENQNKNQK